MRSVNVNKLKPMNFNDTEYEVRRYKDFTKPELYGYDLSDDKAKKQLIDYIEKKLIRPSIEYRNFIKFLKEKLNMNYCSYFNSISTKLKGISIEIHHSPFTLYDLVAIAVNKRIIEEEYIDPLEIAQEVMRKHFEGVIGLIPLSITVHELVHDGKIYIPITFVFGDVSQYYQDNTEYMTKDQKELILKNIHLCKKMEKTPEILKKKFVYMDVEGFKLPEKI